MCRLPSLRLLTRSAGEIRTLAGRLAPVLAKALDGVATVEIVACQSQIGSGALPVESLDSAALSVMPMTGKKGGGKALDRIAAAFRALPMPVVGRVHDGAFLMDLRCLEDEALFTGQLPDLNLDA